MILPFGRRDAAPAPGLAEVRGYWEALRREGRLPHRGQIDPRGMAGALDRVFLAEEIAPGMARLRLAGQALADLMGMEVRGMPLSALFDPLSRRAVEAPLAQLFEGRHAVTLEVEAETGIGRPALAGRVLLLPLEGFAGRPDIALGCLGLAGEVGRTPRRLLLRRTAAEPLDVAQRAARLLEAAEEAAPFTPAPPTAGDRTRLRLVKTS